MQTLITETKRQEMDDDGKPRAPAMLLGRRRRQSFFIIRQVEKAVGGIRYMKSWLSECG